MSKPKKLLPIFAILTLLSIGCSQKVNVIKNSLENSLDKQIICLETKKPSKDSFLKKYVMRTGLSNYTTAICFNSPKNQRTLDVVCVMGNYLTETFYGLENNSSYPHHVLRNFLLSQLQNMYNARIF